MWNSEDHLSISDDAMGIAITPALLSEFKGSQSYIESSQLWRSQRHLFINTRPYTWLIPHSPFTRIFRFMGTSRCCSPLKLFPVLLLDDLQQWIQTPFLLSHTIFQPITVFPPHRSWFWELCLEPPWTRLLVWLFRPGPPPRLTCFP